MALSTNPLVEVELIESKSAAEFVTASSLPEQPASSKKADSNNANSFFI
jgi:hypothetical protein